ncbi:inositol monophosphatase [Ignisphaera aggregans DSM 17230]|uniref:Inositol monophosphatase n=1 Tax=Ignisphaera aggregans (strain DSM 17230 / JCM 13409 / AQ1.S1) TaxID=583356 RepID=E0SS54_IGNAA|nr:inositol monophosphatase [Ignisphaera aggregans DSM 17230]
MVYMDINEIKMGIVKCVDNVRRYLLGETPRGIVGNNVSGDISKEFDLIAEDILSNCLREVLGEVMIIGEERGLRQYGSRWIAIIDPVDGSTNYDAEIPWASISIAIARGGRSNTLKDIEFAIVSEIFRDRMYVYDYGDVRIGERKIYRGVIPKPIVLGYFESYSTYKPLENYIRNRNEKLTIRSLGSAALDIVYVGMGNAEVFIDARAKLRNVDISAALRIAMALGAKAYVCDYRDPLDIPIDRIERIKFILVGFNDRYLDIALSSMNIH